MRAGTRNSCATWRRFEVLLTDADRDGDGRYSFEELRLAATPFDERRVRSGRMGFGQLQELMPLDIDGDGILTGGGNDPRRAEF